MILDSDISSMSKTEAYRRSFLPYLQEKIEVYTTQLIEKDNEEVRGRIKELRQVVDFMETATERLTN